MSVTDRILDLIAHLRRGRRPTTNDLKSRWRCSKPTVYRTVDKAKKKGHLIEFRGGRYHLLDDGKIELPGIRLNADELAGLLGLSHWLETLSSGVLKSRLAPIHSRLKTDLEDQGLRVEDWENRIRLLPMQYRSVDPEILLDAARATLARHRVEFEFRGSRDERYRLRKTSPQSLVRYRDNWYLDAWDHEASKLRCFALSRMRAFRVMNTSAREISQRDLDAHFAESYGIFAGRADRKARVVFTGEAARFIAEEKWHPKQRMTSLPGGRLRLEMPCRDMRELARDVMRYVEDVESVEPSELREILAGRVKRAAEGWIGGWGEIRGKGRGALSRNDRAGG